MKHKCKSLVMIHRNIGNSYRSLVDMNDVYRSTTISGGSSGVLDSVKRAFKFTSTPSIDEKLVVTNKPIVITSRYGKIFIYIL